MLFGEYPIIKLSKKTLASEKIMNTDGHTIDGYKHPIFCGDLKRQSHSLTEMSSQSTSMTRVQVCGIKT